MGRNPDGSTFDWYAKDRTFTSSLLKVAQPEGDVDLSGFSTPTDQLSMQSCVGNATADSVEILNAIEGLQQVQLSRLFIYSCARMLQDDNGDGKNDLNLDEGTYVRLAFDVLARFGVCEETLWPYDLDKVLVSPSLIALRQATGHRIHSYYRIKSTGDGRISDVITALRANHPVVFGTLIDKEFETLMGDGPIETPMGTSIGGHCMIVVGYIGGNFKVKNSWGQSWGDEGFCYMKPDYLTWSGTNDLWVPTLGTRFSPNSDVGAV